MNNQACDWLCDTWTVTHKELRELVAAIAANAVTRAALAALAVIFGIALPWWLGHQWLDGPLILIVWLILPVPLVIAAIAESIAGERERHTLEPLLATRLPVRAILTGKILAAAIFGWLVSLVIMLVGLTVVNLADRGDVLRLYSPGLGSAILWFGLLATLFTACVGVTVSLHATTVTASAGGMVFIGRSPWARRRRAARRCTARARIHQVFAERRQSSPRSSAHRFHRRRRGSSSPHPSRFARACATTDV